MSKMDESLNGKLEAGQIDLEGQPCVTWLISSTYKSLVDGKVNPIVMNKAYNRNPSN